VTRRPSWARPTAALPAVLLAAPLALAAGCAPTDAHAAPPAPATARPSPHGGTGGTGATPATWNLVGLGDSVPVGSNCRCTDFVHLLGQQVQHDTGKPVTTTNLAEASQDSAGLLAQLQDSPETVRAVAAADEVTVTIGANDFAVARSDYFAGDCGGADGLDCFRAELPALRDNLTRILARIHQLGRPHPPAVRVTNYWNVFEDGEVARDTRGDAFMADSDQLTRIANDLICQVTRQAGGVCVDTYTPFKGQGGKNDPTGLLADDGDHPNAAGHRLIAQVLARSGHPGPD
jgi:lysophospholipase L1-like esterase